MDVIEACKQVNFWYSIAATTLIVREYPELQAMMGRELYLDHCRKMNARPPIRETPGGVIEKRSI